MRMYGVMALAYSHSNEKWLICVGHLWSCLSGNDSESGMGIGFSNAKTRDRLPLHSGHCRLLDTNRLSKSKLRAYQRLEWGTERGRTLEYHIVRK